MRTIVDGRKRWLAVGGLTLSLLAAACGGGSSGGNGSGGGGSSPTGGSASCSPSGASLSISAQNIAYSTDSLCAPANQALTIAFDNKDSGIQHNIEIFKDEAMTQSVFKGDLVSGPGTMSYSVDALPAATYHFHCDIHPTQMEGTLVVSG